MRQGLTTSNPATLALTYGIPFAKVWGIALRLAGGGLRGWRLTSWDDVAGVVEARIRGWVVPLPATVVIVVSLDANAQTLVEITAEDSDGGDTLGVNARRIRRFRRALERALAADARRGLNGRPGMRGGP